MISCESTSIFDLFDFKVRIIEIYFSLHFLFEIEGFIRYVLHIMLTKEILILKLTNLRKLYLIPTFTKVIQKVDNALLTDFCGKKRHKNEMQVVIMFCMYTNYQFRSISN